MSKKEEDEIEYAVRVLGNTLVHFDTLSCNEIKRRLQNVVYELKEMIEYKGEEDD